MLESLAALAVFVAIFAIAALRNVPVGIVMLAAACGVGVLLGDMALAEVLDGFPVGTMVILAGVTYFFGIARANGTIDRVIDAVLARIGSNVVLLAIAAGGATRAFAPTGLICGIITYVLIEQVGTWVLQTALYDLAKWRAAGLPIERVARS